jgi:NAD-dependent deacetylase
MEGVLAACREALDRPGPVIALTGAGVSAESGIPTFRGKDGYWTVGAREYHPQELATRAAFEVMPWEVWAWYLYRRSVCRRAEPNPGHRALVRLAAALPERFALVTQNVDGLHRRAGSPDRQSFAIHGDLSMMRCAADCTAGGSGDDRWPIPDAVPDLARGAAVAAESRALLVCAHCGGMARPHVLWFDEFYDEPRFHLETVRRLAARAALVVVAGTSGQTNLPWQVVRLAAAAGATIVDVNPEDNPLGEIAASSGGTIRGPASAALTAIADALIAHRPGPGRPRDPTGGGE